MTKLKKLFLAFFLITSFSTFNSQAMENAEDKQTEEIEQADENYLVIKKEWSEDENYLKITIDEVIWIFGPFNSPDKNEEKQPDTNTMDPETGA